MKTETTFSLILPLILAVAVIPLSANADTVTTNGVTWTYTVLDATKKTVSLGAVPDDTFDVNISNPVDSDRVIPAATEIDASLIPWTFTANGNNYTVTALGSQAFNGCTGLSGTINIPSAVKTLGRACLSSTGVRI